MKLKISVFFGLFIFIAIKAEDNGRKTNGHFEVVYKNGEPDKSFYINLDTKSLYSCDLKNMMMVLIDGGSGSGLVVKMEMMKGTKLKKGWKANGSGDLPKSAREYLAKIESFKDLIDSNEEEIDVNLDKKKIQWYVENILVNIMNPKTRDADINMFVNLELQTLQNHDHGFIYYNLNGKGVNVGVSLTQIQLLNRQLAPILYDIKISTDDLKKTTINWKRAFGYSGYRAVATLIYIEEVIAGLKNRFKDLREGFVPKIAQTCADIIRVKRGDKPKYH